MNAECRTLILPVFAAILASISACSKATTTESKPGTWIRQPAPVWTGAGGLASDPAVIAQPNAPADAKYRMYYTGLAEDGSHTIIADADSADGITWKSISSQLLSARSGSWDENLETCGLIDDRLLLFTGYRDVGKPAKGFPASLGLARSTDGEIFVADNKPILDPTPGGRDNDGIYHPSVLKTGNSYSMAYTGHAYTNDPTTGPIGVSVLLANSSDGITWIKADKPLLCSDPKLPWTTDGVAEPCLLRGLDGKFYLFFTGLKDEQRVIGIARSDWVSGPWTLSPIPILQPTPGSFDAHQVLAPSVIIEGDRVRMWYTAVDDRGRMSVGYAQSRWPIWPQN